jgi:predicted AAA+ superfamily ATPase
MTYIARTLEKAFRRAAAEFPVLLLAGPRQAGKTTLLRHLAGVERRYVDLDDPWARQLAQEDPALFIQRHPPPVLIDEAQHAPQLLPLVQRDLGPRPRPGLVWLTSSYWPRGERPAAEAFPGRCASLQLLGLSAPERRLGADAAAGPQAPQEPPRAAAAGDAEPRLDPAPEDEAGVFAAIWHGAFPALTASSVEAWTVFYGDYLQTYLQRDVRDVGGVGDPRRFLRFLRACAARTGQLLNLSDLARDADISVSTATSWIAVLEASHLVYLLPPYPSGVGRRLVKAPKLYVLDTGLCAFLTQWHSPATLAAGALAGALFETYVLIELLKSAWHTGQPAELFYYRDRDGREVDFVFVAEGQLHAVEARAAATPRSEWARVFGPLRRLQPPFAGGCVACLTTATIPLADGITAVPVIG